MKKLLLSISLIVGAVISDRVNAQIVFRVDSPVNVAGNYDITYASGWGAMMDTVAINGKLVLVDDGSAADSLGCGTLVNGAQITGNIAVVYRGSCEFGMKALNAQNAGAIAVVIINHSGEPISMGGGAVGSSVTIPVIMISTVDGGNLRPFVDAGNLYAFIGNKTGLFGNDIGFYQENVIVARSAGLPTYMAKDNVNVGAWIYNYGYNNQPNVTLTADVSDGTSSLYSNTSAGAAIAAGDSLFVSLPTYSRNGLAKGFYSLTYSIQSDSTDQYNGDNSVVTNFYITDSIYSKSGFYADSLVPRMGGGSASSTSGNDFALCIMLDEADYGTNKAVHGLSFGAGVASGATLIGKSLELQLYEWDFVDTASFAFNDAVRLDDGSSFYDYEAELSYDFVYQKFSNPINLVNGKHYAACVYNAYDSVYLGTDTKIDYDQAEISYNEYFAPILVGGSWDVRGFSGGTNPAAILVHIGVGTIGVEETKAVRAEVVPFPNPAVNYISVPLNEIHNGTVKLEVFDLAGKLVKSESVNMANTKMFNANTSSLENGTYMFNLKFDDNSTTSFRVAIVK